jgi:alpha-1,4-digalacturonate transport system permease protein
MTTMEAPAAREAAVTPRTGGRRRRSGSVATVLVTGIVWLLALAWMFPALWFLLSSFKPGSELFSYPLTLFPKHWTLSGYVTAWQRFSFARYVLNTSVVAVVTTFLTVIVSAATGYAFAKFNNWWLRWFFVGILITTMLPTEVIMPSTFRVILDLGLYNSLAGIIVPSVMTATGTFMFRQYFSTVPGELAEAARIDGAGEFKIFWQIMLPLSRPIAATLAIFSFHWRWNDYIWPLIVLNDPKNYTLQVALRSIVGADNINWSVLLSASIISLIPMVALFIAFSPQIMNADMNSGLKD